MVKIQVKRGPESRLPQLDVGEPAFTTDNKRYFVGSDEGNIELANKSDVDELSAKVDEVAINVKSYGAKGDGVTDNTTIIQTAIDSVSSSGGGTVFIPKGVYITKQLYMKPNVTLEGAGIDITILKYAANANNANTDSRVVSMNDNTTVRKLTINGNWDAHKNGVEHMHCVFVYDKQNVLVEQCKLTNARGDGISITGSDISSKNVTVKNCTIADNHRSDIVIEQVSHLKILDCFVSNAFGRPNLHFEPFVATSMKDAVFSGNTFKTNAVDGDYCVTLRGESYLNCYEGIVFTGNYVDAPNAVILLGSVKDTIISDNILHVKQVEAWYYNRNISITNNRIKSSDDAICIHEEGVHWSEDIIISGNQIETPKMGVYLKGTIRTTVKGNNFKGMAGATNAIYVWATSITSDTIIEGNVIQGFAKALLTETYGSNVISNLTFLGNTSYSMLQFYGTVENVQITSNKLSGNGTLQAIYLNQTGNQKNFVITDNTIKNWSQALYSWSYSTNKLENVILKNNILEKFTGTSIGANAGTPIEFYLYDTVKPVDVIIGDNIIKDFKTGTPISTSW